MYFKNALALNFAVKCFVMWENVKATVYFAFAVYKNCDFTKLVRELAVFTRSILTMVFLLMCSVIKKQPAAGGQCFRRE